MKKSKLYQYAVLYHPTEEQFDEGKRSEILVPLTTILAINESVASMTAFRSLPSDFSGDLDQVEVVIRPF